MGLLQQEAQGLQEEQVPVPLPSDASAQPEEQLLDSWVS